MQVPKSLTAVHWYHLLTECTTSETVKDYLQKARLREMYREARKKQRVEKFMNEHSRTGYSMVNDQFSRNMTFATTKVRHMLHGHPLIIDLDYSVSHSEQIYTLAEIMDCYGLNSKHSEGFHIYITSIDKQERLYSEYKAGFFDGVLAEFCEDSFYDIFPREKLVYLSPEAPKLKDYNPDDIYIIGGLLDLEQSHSSYEKATELGIRCGSLPIDDYGW